MPIPDIARPGPQASGRPAHNVHDIRRRLGGRPASAGTPFDPLPRDIPGVARSCLDWAIQRAAGAAVPDIAERLAVAAAGWARDGIPIDVVLHSVHEGLQVGLEKVHRQAVSADPGTIVSGTAAVLEILGLVTVTVGKAYVREYKAAVTDRDTAVHTLTSALLGGHAIDTLARECGTRIAEEYVVIAVSLPPHSDEADPRLDARIMARRKLRRVRAALATLFGDEALSLLSVVGGTILVPSPRCADAGLEEAVHRLSAAAQVPITATVVRAVPREVSSAAQRAHEMLDMVERDDRAPGLYRFAELALEYQLTRPGSGRELLDARLAPLDRHPELMETLQVYIRGDFSRQRAARQLNIHPNTVDYRLRRIGELTGLMPSDATGLWYLQSALTARSGQAGHPRRGTSSLDDRRPA